MQLQRYYIKVFLTMLLVLFACVSCVTDEWIDDVTYTNSDDNDTPYYLSVQINFASDAPSTRAASDVTSTDGHGTAYGDEHDIGPSGNKIIFFKEDKGVLKLFGVYSLFAYDEFLEQLTTEEKQELDDDISDNGDLKDNEEAKYTYLTRFFSTNDPEELPTSFLVLLNGNKAMCDLLELYHQQVTKTQKTYTYNDILEMVWKDDNDPRNIGFSDASHKYFTMTNSMYMPEVHFDDENKEYYKRGDYVNAPVALKVSDGNNAFFPTIAGAKKNPVRTYVERMVAKHTFEIKKTIFQPSKSPDIPMFEGLSAVNHIPVYSLRNWKIEVTGWDINALQRQTYLFKKLPTETEVMGWEWNDAANHRSYWSEDPDYSKTGEEYYPWQHRQLVDKTEVKNYDDFEHQEGGQNILKNYSFEDLGLFPKEENDVDLDKLVKKVVYTPEHTYNNKIITDELYDNRSELLAGTHLLVGARLLLGQNNQEMPKGDGEEGNGEEGNGNGGDGEEGEKSEGSSDADATGGSDVYDEIENLYRDRHGLYYLSERECFVAMVHAFNQQLSSQMLMRYIPYDWVNGGRINTNTGGNGWWQDDETPKSDTLVAKTSGQYILYWKNDPMDDDFLDELLKKTDDEFERDFGSLAPAMLFSGDGRLLPWFENSIETGKISIRSIDGTKPLVIHKAKKDDYDNVIDGDIFHQYADVNDVKSLLYEWLGPIDHFKKGYMYYACGIYSHEKEAAKEEENEKLYGVVRNNWYKFVLKDIKSMGVPVDNPEQPIVPDRVGAKDQINITAKILDWHYVETSIPLLPD